MESGQGRGDLPHYKSSLIMNLLTLSVWRSTGYGLRVTDMREDMPELQGERQLVHKADPSVVHKKNVLKTSA